MNWDTYEKWLRGQAADLALTIYGMTGAKISPEDLRGFLQQLLINFLAERRDRAPKVLEILPDFEAKEFAALLQGDLEVGDKIEIRTIHYLIESIVEEVRILSDIKLNYKH